LQLSTIDRSSALGRKGLFSKDLCNSPHTSIAVLCMSFSIAIVCVSISSFLISTAFPAASDEREFTLGQGGVSPQASSSKQTPRALADLDLRGKLADLEAGKTQLCPSNGRVRAA
jgi:hypothetical protein